MTATAVLKVFTGTDAGTVHPDATTGDASNWNLMSIDDYDDTGSLYTDNPITVPDTGTSYSYERWMAVQFNGTFNEITNIKSWKSSGTLSDGNLALYAGGTTTAATPVNTDSTVATTSMPTAEGSAIGLSTGTNPTTDGDRSDYLIVQLDVPSTVTTPGDIGTQTLTLQYDEQ